MTELVIVSGVSGSGKSTWAQAQGLPIVSRDLIRLALWGEESMQDEELVTLFEHAALSALLKAGRDCISDNTNIEWKYINALVKLAHSHGATVRRKVFDVPLETCIMRNDKRAMMGGRNVPHEVIRRQHQRFQGTKDRELPEPFMPEPYRGSPGLPKAFLVDIDGTLAHMNGRSPYDWKRVGEDSVDEVVAEVVRGLIAGNAARQLVGDVDEGLIAIMMSGRDGSCFVDTYEWLHDNNIPFDHLFMRPAGDQRRDDIIKAELFDKHVRNEFDVQFVIDDRLQVVRMWQRMGLKVLNVAGLDGGDF